MNIAEHNRRAWNREVKDGNIWTKPVDSETVAQARQGEWQIVLTPTKPVPKAWFGDLRGRRVLCLASGGGQQGPILAAAGAFVTVFDNSPAQLAQDQMVAERDRLKLRTVEGDMRDLSAFPDNSFDLIIHPVSNCFVDDVNPVWQGAFRVLQPGGSLLAGFCNPVTYMFDFQEWDTNQRLVVRYSIPYADTEQLPPDQLQVRIDREETLEFGHTLADQIGGQLRAGFLLKDFFEDIANGDLLDPHIPTFGATWAWKPDVGRW